jgi:outer membrane protein assembly factor BamD
MADSRKRSVLVIERQSGRPTVRTKWPGNVVESVMKASSVMKYCPSAPLRCLIVGLGLLILAGCSGNDDEVYVERPVEDLYNAALDDMSNTNYREAGRAFEEVERQHPYSQWATRAQLMAAYAFYEANDYDESIAAAQRFIDLHPGHPDVAYAYYLVGVCYYEQISDIGRDQAMTEQALASFDELIRRFNNSKYARDAQLKADLARDHLAGKEMEIGRYYQKHQEYVAAINRFRSVIEKYQTTTHVAEALHRLTEVYLALGVEDEARSAAAVLGYNYPGSPWYERSYALLEERDLAPAENDKSWLAGLF